MFGCITESLDEKKPILNLFQFIKINEKLSFNHTITDSESQSCWKFQIQTVFF